MPHDLLDPADLAPLDRAKGLEALSRGAAEAILVEQSRPAARTLTANIAAVGCLGARVLIRDVAQLAQLPTDGFTADLVFMDPPYDVAAANVRDVLTALCTASWIAQDALVVVERPARDTESPCPDLWPEPRRRPYGDTVLWYGRAVSAADTGDAKERD